MAATNGLGGGMASLQLVSHPYNFTAFGWKIDPRIQFPVVRSAARCILHNASRIILLYEVASAKLYHNDRADAYGHWGILIFCFTVRRVLECLCHTFPSSWVDWMHALPTRQSASLELVRGTSYFVQSPTRRSPAYTLHTSCIFLIYKRARKQGLLPYAGA